MAFYVKKNNFFCVKILFFVTLHTKRSYLQKQINMAVFNPFIEEYRNFVSSLAKGDGVNRVFMNSDEDKALVVLVELFKSAKNTVRIFAGSLYNCVGNRSEYVIALSEFIERGGELRILLNNYNEEFAKKSNLYKRLAYYKSQGKPVFIKTTNSRPYRTGDIEKKEVHFTIGDEKSYRIETDTEKRTAECNFNSPELAKTTADFFDMLFNREDAKEIQLLKLFEYDN